MQRDRQRAGLCRLPQAGSAISRAATSARTDFYISSRIPGRLLFVAGALRSHAFSSRLRLKISSQ